MTAVTKDAVTAVTEPVVNADQYGALVTAVTKREFDRADALMRVTQGDLRGDRVNRSLLEVTVTISADMEIGCMQGAAIDAYATRRLSCDAGVVEVTEDAYGVPPSVGRKRRTLSGRSSTR